MTISVFCSTITRSLRRGIVELLEYEDDIAVISEAGTATSASAPNPAAAP